MAAVSYSVAVTPVNQSASSIAVPSPPAYVAGDLLVMGVTGTASTAGTGVSASTPSGWTRLSPSGGQSVFTKTATGSEPASYTVTMGASCAIAAYVAAFPAATVASSTFGSSSAGSVSYSPAFPGGVTSGQVVLVAGAAITSSGSVDTPVGNANFNFPAAGVAEVPAFAPALPNAGPYSGAAGLCSVPGSAASGTALLSSGQQCTFYAGFIVLNVTGTNTSLSVTATVAYPAGTLGLALTVKALSGAASVGAITSGGATEPFQDPGVSGPPQAAITPNASGSLVYGAVTANFGVSGTSAYTPASGTTFSQNVAPTSVSEFILGTLRSTGTTTSGSPLTLGGSAPANSFFTAAYAEVLAAGTLTETATATAAGTLPGHFATTSIAQTAVFRNAPATGSLLVAMVSANSDYNFGGGVNASVTLSDSSGLTWTPLAQVTYPSYSGVWIASTAPTTASLTVAPVKSATARRGHFRTASATVTPVRTAAAPGQFNATAALTVVPVRTATPLRIGPVTSPVWSAARNGLPGDVTAVNRSAQVSQFLAGHGITAVYQGTPVWPPAETSATNPFFWMSAATDVLGWLPANDVSQPFSFSGTAVGRVEIGVQAVGNAADLVVTLCPDNGSGAPDLSAPLASTTIPAAQVLALTAPAGLASGPPLATSRGNAALLAQYTSAPWSQPAVSLNGAGTYATPVTSGNWTVFLGGFDSTASAAIATVSAVQYLGNGVLAAAVPQPSLPQAAWYVSAAATTDTMVAAGGINAVSGLASVWTASWDSSTGTLGAWSAQQALPAAVVSGAMAAWNTTVYVIGGSPDGTSARATAGTWFASAANGQVTAWTAGPSLPQALTSPYAAVVGNWLVVAGGANTSGTALTATWYSAVNADGSLAGWQQGPALPQAGYTFAPSWNLAVTDSAVLILSGAISGIATSVWAQSLTVSADGPAPSWHALIAGAGLLGDYQAAAFPSSVTGAWDVVAYHLTGYDTAQLYTVPVLSVPLPATGLTPSTTYHLVIRQQGGDATNNYLQLGQIFAPSPLEWLSSPRGSGGPWTATTPWTIALNVYDQTAGGPVLHTWEDSGARVMTLVWGAGNGQLLGCCEATEFLDGTMLPAVTQVTYGTTGLPSGLVQLA